jgi:hypothetical protein
MRGGRLTATLMSTGPPPWPGLTEVAVHPYLMSQMAREHIEDLQKQGAAARRTRQARRTRRALTRPQPARRPQPHPDLTVRPA